MRYLTILLILISSLANAQNIIITSAEPVDFQLKVDDLLKAGKVADAISYMSDLHKTYPDNEAMTNSLSSLYRELGFLESDEAKKITAFEKGMALADEVIKKNPKNGRAHFAYAANLGRLAQFKGGKEKVNYSKRIKEHAKLAIKYEPEYAANYYMLSVWHYEVVKLSPVLKAAIKVLFGGMPEASMASAKSYAKRAIELDPKVGLYQLQFAKVEIELGNDKLAKEHLNLAINCIPRMPSDKLYLEEAKQLLATIK